MIRSGLDTDEIHIYIQEIQGKKVLVDFSKYLVSHIDEIKNLRSPVIEEFDFQGNSFSWLIRFSDVKLEVRQKISNISFMKMQIHFNLAERLDCP